MSMRLATKRSLVDVSGAKQEDDQKHDDPFEDELFDKPAALKEPKATKRKAPIKFKKKPEPSAAPRSKAASKKGVSNDVKTSKARGALKKATATASREAAAEAEVQNPVTKPVDTFPEIDASATQNPGLSLPTADSAQGQSLKRSVSDAGLGAGASAPKRIIVDEDQSSDLSELGSTPVPPRSRGASPINEVLQQHSALARPPVADFVNPSAEATSKSRDDSAAVSPLDDSTAQQPSSPETRAAAAVATSPSQTLPTPETSQRTSSRTTSRPSLFAGVVATPGELAYEQPVADTAEDSEQDPPDTSDSPTASKASRKRKAPATKATPRKSRKASKKISASEEAQDDGIETPKASRKKSAASKKTSISEPADGDEDETPKVSRKTPTSRKKPAKNQADTPVSTKKPRKKSTTKSANHAQESLPSPPVSQSDYLEASGLTIEPELLALSKALTHREPLASKPDARGEPEVWAPGRQALCETLPYYKSAHSGCYANGGNIYAFMFDSVGVTREYMDADHVIARMGGSMASDKNGLMYQTEDHDINDVQPQSMLNGIAHRNPLVIICGDKNAGSPAKMPHRYCVLGWFKPTHVWAELTIGKTKPMITIRYRFERLDRSKPSWYAPVPGIDESPEVPADLDLPEKTCTRCNKSCPQVYLIDWMCTNPKCDGLWRLSNGEHAPYGELDYHPAFLKHETKWEKEEAPFSLNPGVPDVGRYFGDNLAHVSTRGIVCPSCGRCNSRYLFSGWQCDTAGCAWKLTPKHQVVMPSNLHHTPWDMASDGPSLIKAAIKPVVRTQVKYFHNHKVVKYTFDGVEGSVIVAKANKKVTSEPGGPDDMFRNMQTSDVGLERRMLRKTAEPAEPAAEKAPKGRRRSKHVEEEDGVDSDMDDELEGEVGTRMTSFGMNFGMPYKFIASGDSQSFEDAPTAVRAARSRLNWAQKVFVNDASGYQDFNEELIFAYMEGQKIKYHDDGEEGLGPRIATLSLGASATMSLRIKVKYYSQTSNTGVFTYEEPLPLALLESSGYTSGFRGKKTLKPVGDTYEGRVAAFAELQQLKESGNHEAFRRRSKELHKELELHRGQAAPILSFHLTHGDVVFMEGEQIQKYLEHELEPHGNLRFALTCRTVLPHHLKPDQLPSYEVKPDTELYDGSAIREDGDGAGIEWD